MVKNKKQINKRGISIILIINLILSIIVFSVVVGGFSEGINAEASPWPAFNVCCEKTTNGAWCQNTLEENCAEGFRKTPTSCDATSFCKSGICYDGEEGLCMENTPQKVCNNEYGTWIDDRLGGVPQCNLGCCVLGIQASFVTLTRCKKLSADYGLETNFRTDIGDEVTCIATASLGDEGACVYEIDYQRTCKFTTRQECTGMKTGEGQTSGIEFFNDRLCSDSELATNCGKSTKTTCIEGKDEVYFVDTCGNPANIYDASRQGAGSYWNIKIDKSQSCNYGSSDGSAGSASCGNCDYFQGSICSKGSATFGNYVCRDLSCDVKIYGESVTKQNGESWCIYDGNVGDGADVVGSRHFRHVCISGEETIEPCADFRGEICYEADLSVGRGKTFIEAACRVNRWQDCIDQDEEEACLNTDKRDCYWSEGAHFTGLEEISASSTGSSGSQTFSGGNTGGFLGGLTGQAIFGGDDDDDDDKNKGKGKGLQIGGGACLPMVPKGLKFWNDGDAGTICGLGNSACVVEYEKGLISDKKVIKNKECLEEGYAQQMNNVCTSLGDCGAYVNIAGKFTTSGAEWKIKGSKQTIGQGIMNEAKKKAGV